MKKIFRWEHSEKMKTKQKITKGYKYMNSDDTTKNNTKWGYGVTHEVIDGGWELCTKGLIHFYEDKYIATLMDPLHAEYTLDKNCVMRTCVAEGEVVTDNDLKCGAKKVTTGKKVKTIELTLEQRVECAIRISLLVYNESSFVEWAEKWLSGEDRSYDSARATYRVIDAARAADIAYAYDAAHAANDAVRAAAYAANTAYAADTTHAYDDACAAYAYDDACIAYNVAVAVAYTITYAVDAGVDEKQIEKIIKMVVKKRKQNNNLKTLEVN